MFPGNFQDKPGKFQGHLEVPLGNLKIFQEQFQKGNFWEISDNFLEHFLDI